MNVILILFCFIQGFTEFLPVSSQAHLIVFNQFFYLENQNFSPRELNILVHFGSLIAIISYFYKDCAKIIISFGNFFRSDIDTNVSLTKNIIVSSIPLFFFGYIIATTINEQLLYSLKLIGWTTLLFGIILFFIDKTCLRIKTIDFLPMKTAFFIGMTQCIALIPGASRSGLVISCMRLSGYTRYDSAKYSNLLSIPAISGAMGYLILSNYSEGFNYLFKFNSFLIILLSFFFSILFIHFLMKWVQKSSFAIFMYYRITLGLILIFFSYVKLENISW